MSSNDLASHQTHKNGQNDAKWSKILFNCKRYSGIANEFEVFQNFQDSGILWVFLKKKECRFFSHLLEPPPFVVKNGQKQAKSTNNNLFSTLLKSIE